MGVFTGHGSSLEIESLMHHGVENRVTRGTYSYRQGDTWRQGRPLADSSSHSWLRASTVDRQGPWASSEAPCRLIGYIKPSPADTCKARMLGRINTLQLKDDAVIDSHWGVFQNARRSQKNLVQLSIGRVWLSVSRTCLYDSVLDGLPVTTESGTDAFELANLPGKVVNVIVLDQERR